MVHPIYTVESFRIAGPYLLEIKFNDGSDQRIDFLPVLKGSLFGPLKDITTFNQVRIDPEVKTLVWPNGADLDPATLRYWPQYVADLTARAATWK